MTAAPGVDHAIRIGFRVASDITMDGTPMPMPIAHSQEAVCSGVAPRFWVAWKMIATELVNPTSTDTKPVTRAESEKSFSMAAARRESGPACRGHCDFVRA